ncbi:MAG: isocitrate lyase/PEP mutase family protein [bacterium]
MDEAAVPADRAQTLRDLHRGPDLLILPNVWDPLGARMLAALGFPAVATASASVAFSLGYDDGQRIRIETMLDVIRRIAAAVAVPVTADLESGWAVDAGEVAANVRRAMRAGAAGINLEDSVVEGGALLPIEQQCARLRAVVRMAREDGIPLVVNARTDVFLRGGRPRPDLVAEAIERGIAYREAGADCFYPIGAGDVPTLAPIRDAVQLPLNVLATASTAPLHDLRAAGVARVSFGPGLLRVAVTAMRSAVESMRRTGTYEAFTDGVLTSGEIREWVSPEREE